MKTLATLLDDHVAAGPDAVATYDVGDDGTLLPTTRRAFATRVTALTDELRAVGVRPGQCIAVYLPNWSDTLIWQFAAAAVGAHVIGVNTRYNVGEIAHILISARPVVVAVADRFHGLDLHGRLADAVAGVTDVATPAVAVVPGPGYDEGYDDRTVGAHDFDLGGGAWQAGTGQTGAVHVPDAPDMADYTVAGVAADTDDRLIVAFTTSGSTGTPKLAAHREAAVCGHALADAAAMNVERGDVVLCVLPVSGVFGFNTAFAGLAGGAALLMEPVFDATATLRRMAAGRVTHVVGGDDLFGRLRDTWPAERPDLSSLKVLGIADFLGRSHDIARWARDEFGAVTTGVFGSSEIFSLSLLWHLDDDEKLRWNGGGRPVAADIEFRVVDPVDDLELPDGEQGEMQVRGPNVVDAYLGNPDTARTAFTADGWFRSGDLGVATGDGGYTYVCRMGDVLRLRGFLVDPAEIEQRIAAHPGVELVKVVGTTADGGYAAAVAFVVPSGAASVDAESIKKWCAATLAAFKVPSSVHIIDAMPMTAGGNGTKIRAVELREWAQQWSDNERDYRYA